MFAKAFLFRVIKSQDCMVQTYLKNGQKPHGIENNNKDDMGQDFFCRFINSLPNNKNLDLSNLKAFADDKINVNEKL